MKMILSLMDIVFRFKDMIKVKIKNDMLNKILKNEGLTSNIVVPNIDISNWKTVFESLRCINKNIIIEKQIDGIDEDEELVSYRKNRKNL